MHIIHSFKEKSLDEHAHRDCSFLLTNKRGNYLSLGQDNFTHMQGLFFLEQDSWQLYKAIEDIKLSAEHSGEMIALRNNFFNGQRIYKQGAEETFALFNNSMLYSLKGYEGEIVVELDFRGIFDKPELGRIYSITIEGKAGDAGDAGDTGDAGGTIIIRYDQYSDASCSHLEKTRFMAIKGASEWRRVDEWSKKDYSYDKRRGSASEYYIYKALAIKANSGQALKLVFSFSGSNEKAVEHANTVYDNYEYITNSVKNYCAHTFTSKELAMNSAMKALDDLLITIDRKERKVGILAGLPWFYQLWARDELISLKALIIQEKYHLAKSILLKYLKSINNEGMITSRFPGNQEDVKSIDSVGWLFFRLKELISILISKKTLAEHFSSQELEAIKRAAHMAIYGLAHHRSSNGLIINNEQETWMDTKPAKRSGLCIEIQALFLSMLSLHNQLSALTKGKPLFKSLEKELKAKVRSEFFSNGVLKDRISKGLSDDAARPNIFLAYYIYPELLSAKEWKQAFNNTLHALWLDWGGLTTISHNSPLFKSGYTGVDDASYHNGDSWYYINNYAAIAMNRLDPDHFHKYIRRIVQASKEEMLFSGFIGCCAEVSSAKHMKSEGCLSQAWSSASLIELLHELYEA